MDAMLTWAGWPALAEHAWAYPALEVLHIVGIALLLGNLVLVELRIWGRGATLPLRPLAALALKVSLVGFALSASSGLLMFGADPQALLANPAFQLKLALLLLAGGNAALFHARDGLGRADGVARTQTAASLGLWLGVIVCGRWIAYS